MSQDLPIFKECGKLCRKFGIINKPNLTAAWLLENDLSEVKDLIVWCVLVYVNVDELVLPNI